MKNILRGKKNFKNAIFVFLIAFSEFLAFEPLFASLKQNAAQEFASAIFGTIFAAVITIVLLSKQTEKEEEKTFLLPADYSALPLTINRGIFIMEITIRYSLE